MEAIVITPVKNSPGTTRKTIEAVAKANGNFRYVVFNDFSSDETKNLLLDLSKKYNFEITHLEDLTKTPSPNYHLVLKIAQQIAINAALPLILIESDVVIKPDTITQLVHLSNTLKNPGLIGAITVDCHENFNFPYANEKKSQAFVSKTNRSLSFCCTLISHRFLQKFSFENLPEQKDWYDVFISHQARKSGFTNYLAKGLTVLHLPHSSRPWKQLKYTNPVKYYLNKFLKKRDRI